MSVGTKLLQAAAGNAGEAVYVEDVFSTFLYEGNATSRSIVNGIDLADKGGLVWTKNRDDSYDHNFVDSARGLTNSPYIRSNTTGSQGTDGGGITAFNSNGYTVGNSGSWNANGNSHVSWTFAKQEKFFDIVTYTGDGSTNKTISHNLGSTPGTIIVKCTSASYRWNVWHRSLTSATTNTNPSNAYILKLNTTDTEELTSSGGIADVNDSTFDVGGVFANNTGETFVAYLFGHNEAEYGQNSDEAIIYCDSFTNDSSSVGVEVNVGFEPQWLLIKGASTGSGLGSWQIIDSMRNANLKPNSNSVDSSTVNFKFTSRGFTPTTYYDGTLAYVAIRRPNKPASEFAATDLFTLQAKSPGEGADTFISTGFNVDTFMYRKRSSSATVLGDRLRGQAGGPDLLTNAADTEGTNTGAFFLDNSNGVVVDYSGGHFNVAPAATDENYIRYFFRRAKGFYDVVLYTGTGSGTTFNHNLGVTPELMWIKARSGAADQWVIWDKNADLSTTTPLFSDFTQARRYNRLSVNSTAPTASVFSIGPAGYSTNTNGVNYIAYLFASVDGISKIGTYSGTGSNVNVDCGFSAGARFVLIWRTDSSGPGWYVYDSARGIVAGNDPYSLLGATDAEVTNTDYIDPLNAGFTVTSSAPAALNTSGGTYTFLAIA